MLFGSKDKAPNLGKNKEQNVMANETKNEDHPWELGTRLVGSFWGNGKRRYELEVIHRSNKYATVRFDCEDPPYDLARVFRKKVRWQEGWFIAVGPLVVRNLLVVPVPTDESLESENESEGVDNTGKGV